MSTTHAGWRFPLSAVHMRPTDVDLKRLRILRAQTCTAGFVVAYAPQTAEIALSHRSSGGKQQFEQCQCKTGPCMRFRGIRAICLVALLKFLGWGMYCYYYCASSHIMERVCATLCPLLEPLLHQTSEALSLARLLFVFGPSSCSQAPRAQREVLSPLTHNFTAAECTRPTFMRPPSCRTCLSFV